MNSKIWDSSDESGILPVLRISYNHLPWHLKRCFAFCAILPKDYEFRKEEVVILWIAEGLVQQSEDNEQMEDLGREYFHALLSRSMFQPSNNNHTKFIMHDLINDLAQWVSGDECFRLEDEYRTSNNQKGLIWLGILHTAVVNIMTNKNLKSSTNLGGDWYNYFYHYMSNVALCDLLPKLKRLSVLSLRKYCVIELTNAVGGSKHLRYLNLSGTMINNFTRINKFLVQLAIFDISRMPSSHEVAFQYEEFDQSLLS